MKASLQSLHARLDRIEEAIKGPEKWHLVRYFAPLDMPDDEREAAEAKARAEYEEKNGPIDESASICWLIRIVNAPRESPEQQQAAAAEMPATATESAQDAITSDQAPVPPIDPETERKRREAEKQREADRRYQEMMNKGIVRRDRDERTMSRDDFSGF